MDQTPCPRPRWQALKNLFTFQFKLGMDALRDLVLSPISFGCVALDFLFPPRTRPGFFERLMAFGRKTDHWINLFGEYSRQQADPRALPDLTKDDTSAPPAADGNVDLWFDRLETLLQEQHRQGGLSAGAKRAIDNYLALIAEQSATADNKDGQAAKPPATPSTDKNAPAID